MIKIPEYHIHYRHPDGRKIGDVMPFFHQGVFHIFYLLNGSGHDDINHEHALSHDLLHWRNVAPSILHEDNCAFTGSYLRTPDGRFHCFFTRWNPENPAGRETIGHAHSANLIEWEKTALRLVPDGHIYSDARYRDFRDPCVFFDERDHHYHMLLLTNAKQQENTALSWDENWIQGHYRSSDLRNWEPLPPLGGNFADECPDYIFHSGRHYIHGCHRYAIGPTQWGPYHTEEDYVLDKGLRAAKTCPVGDRLFWFGGFIGGSFTLPREIVFLPTGRLGLRPAREVDAAATKLLDRYNMNEVSLRFDQCLAHRVTIDTAGLATIEIASNEARISLVDGILTFISGDQKIQLDCHFGYEAITKQIDLFIDGDLLELYWHGKGAFTWKSENPLGALSLKLSRQTLISHFSF